MKCFYHSADLDGHCSGAIVKLANPECEMVGFNYGQEFLWDTIGADETIFMVDVSLPMDDMYRLHHESGGLVWIDHHISAINDLKAHPQHKEFDLFGLRRTDEAACELVWRWFYDGEKEIPPAVSMLGIYDSWRFTDEQEPAIKAFQYGMRAENETRPENAMDFWKELFASSGCLGDLFEVIGTRGELLYKYQMVQNEKTARACAFETRLYNDGMPALRCIAINSPMMNSDVFKSVYDPEQHDAMLCFYRSKRGFWRCSIYSDQDHIDCSAYAKGYGGGGHKGAAGFQIVGESLPFCLTMAEG